LSEEKQREVAPVLPVRDVSPKVSAPVEETTPLSSVNQLIPSTESPLVNPTASTPRGVERLNPKILDTRATDLGGLNRLNQQMNHYRQAEIGEGQ
jgi:hypothetical protein